MSASTISRPTVTDDDGSGTTGTIFNAAWVADLCDRIDAMIAWSYKQKSTTYTLVNTDDVMEATSGTWTLTLHAANDATRGYAPVTILNTGSGVLTVARAGSDTIGQALTSLTIGAGEGVVLQSNGSNHWAIVMSNFKNPVSIQHLDGAISLPNGTTGDQDVTLSTQPTLSSPSWKITPRKDLSIGSAVGVGQTGATVLYGPTVVNVSGTYKLRFNVASHSNNGTVSLYYSYTVEEIRV